VGGRVPLLAILATFGWTVAANAAPADACHGPPARPGAIIHGPVLQVSDGSSFCVALSPSPSTWVRIPLPRLWSTRSALMAAAFGRNATCVVGSNGVGDCRIAGRPLADELQRPEIVNAAETWR
jgi:hypothetical protein